MGRTHNRENGSREGVSKLFLFIMLQSLMKNCAEKESFLKNNSHTSNPV